MIRTTWLILGFAALIVYPTLECPASDFTFDFLVDPEHSESYGGVTVLGHIGLDIVGDSQDQQQPGSPPRTPDQYLLGPKQWGMQIPTIFATAGNAYASGQTGASLTWQDPVIRIRSWAEAFLSTDLIGHSIFYSDLEGTVRLKLGSSIFSDGTPVYLMILKTTDKVVGFPGGGDTENIRKGPEGSGIQDGYYIGGPSSLFQIGDTYEFNWRSSTDASLEAPAIQGFGGESYEGRYEFRIRKPEPGEISRRSLGGGPHFTSDTIGHGCAHATMAMILDSWGQDKRYSDLLQNSQEEYYAAMDKITAKGSKLPSEMIAALNDYFAAKNGCRFGKPVSLRAVGPYSLHELDIERMRHPFIMGGPGIEGYKEGHVFVVDGYYRIQRSFHSGENDKTTWLAVRDTWPKGLDRMVSVSREGNPQYRGCEEEGQNKNSVEWWPLNYSLSESLRFWDDEYRFRPSYYLEIQETFPFNGSPNEIRNFELSGDDFDRVVLPQVTTPLTPPQIWQEYMLMSNVQVLPADARVVSSLMAEYPDDPYCDSYTLRVQLQQPVTAEVALACYSTKKVTVEFDYACTAGTLKLYANNVLLATLPKTPTTDLDYYEKTFTLPTEGTTTFSLRLTGAAGNELYLDNLWLTNPVAEQIRTDLDGNERTDQADFARLAAQWLKSGCTTPNFCGGADINHSGTVDLTDLELFVDLWMVDTRDPLIAVMGNADLDRNFRVDIADLAQFAMQWKRSPCYDPDFCLGADINQSGAVDLQDLALFASRWLDEMF